MKTIYITLLLLFVVGSHPKLKTKSTGNAVKKIGYRTNASKTYASLNKKELDTSNQKSNDSKRYLKCDSIWENYAKKMESIDSLISLKVDNSPLMPIVNKNLLLALLQKNDSLLKIERPLSAIFQGLDSLPFLISNYTWVTSGNGFKIFTPEQKILKKHDSVSYNFENAEDMDRFVNNWNSRKYYPKAALELSKNTRKFFIYSKNKIYNSVVTAIGIQNSECDDGYFFYNFDCKGSDDDLLIASPYLIELDFGNWSDKDKIIQNQPIHDCYDCLHSNKLIKTFAKLKGTNGFYFTYVGDRGNTEKLDTPSRGLIYIDESDNVYNIWDDEIDLFGCGCL